MPRILSGWYTKLWSKFYFALHSLVHADVWPITFPAGRNEPQSKWMLDRNSDRVMKSQPFSTMRPCREQYFDWSNHVTSENNTVGLKYWLEFLTRHIKDHIQRAHPGITVHMKVEAHADIFMRRAQIRRWENSIMTFDNWATRLEIGVISIRRFVRNRTGSRSPAKL